MSAGHPSPSASPTSAGVAPPLPSGWLLHWKPYAQLIRLPNVFTAFADIILGALATAALPGRSLSVLLLLLASGCLYCGGMVWNDFFDLEQDRRERPFRPLPSGRVSRGQAASLGIGLLAMGVAFAALTGLLAPSYRSLPVSVAGLLVMFILLYDGWMKRTWLGPLAMGTCRFLNVLLGLSAAENWPGEWGLHLAAVVGLYIVGVTWFARTEARASRQSTLAAGAAVMLAGLLFALPLPAWFPPGTSWFGFPYLLVGLGFFVGIPVSHAVVEPSPSRVQAAVKRAIMGLVVLDAVLATALAGVAGLLILLLLLPALYLGRWIYST